ncbi:MAG: hypothetical protein WAQ05_05925 [Rubrivivax sp.]
MKMALTTATTPGACIGCLSGGQHSHAHALRRTVQAAAPQLEERLKPGGRYAMAALNRRLGDPTDAA